MLEAGFELTFTNAALITAGAARGELEYDTPENLAASARLACALRDAFAEDVVMTMEDDRHGFPRHVLTFRDGHWLKVEIDPWVVEITGQPRTLAGYRAVHARMTRVFEIAATCDVVPHERIGGGHVHLSRASFGTDGVAIRNFIVDYANHPELALGVLGCDPLNAPPLSAAPPASIAAFEAGLAAFDQDRDLVAFLHHLRTEVYTFAGAPHLPATAPRSKYQALSVDLAETLELRAIRPQRSFGELLAILELFAARIAFLAGRGPIAYRHQAWSVTAPMPPALARDRFATYLAEMDLAGWTRP